MQAAMAGSNDLDGSPGICHALNKDTLEEVAAHCSVDTLLNLQQTCTTFSHLLANSERVWFRKLAEDFGLQLKALPANDTLLAKLAQTVYEASRTSRLRFQGALVTGGVDEDAMQYWVDNMFKPDKAPYCSNCSYNADCMALLLDGEVPRDVEFAAARAYMVRRCRYAAALIMNVQLPQQDRDPDAVMDILDDWSDAQLESFFRDLVAALNQGHALGRLLVYDIEHDRIPQEQQRIQAVDAYLRNRLKGMKAGMLKPPHRPNTMLDSTVLDKINDPARHRMAAVVSEVELSREGNLTCPVSSGVVLVGHIDYERLAGLPPDRVLLELEAATQDPVCTSFNFLSSTEQVEAAAAAGRIPPISVTDQTLAGIVHEFDSTATWQPAAQQTQQQQQQQQQQAQQQQPGGSSAAMPPAVVPPGAARAGPEAAGAAAGPSTSAAAAAAGPSTSAAAAAAAALAAGSAVVAPTAPAGAAPTAAAAGALPPPALVTVPVPRPQALHPPFSPDAPPPGGTPLQGQLVSWRPLVWFHFHKYAECVEFVREHHTLLEATAPNYASACVRYRGPQNMLPGCLHLPTVRAQQAALAARRAAAAEAGPSQAPPAAAAAGPSSSAAAAAGGMQPPPHLMRHPPQQQQLQQRPGLDQPPPHLMAGPSSSAVAAQQQAQWHHHHQQQQQQQQGMLDPFGPAGGVAYGGAAMPGAAGGFGPDAGAGAGAGAGGSGGYASSQGDDEQEEGMAAVAAAAAGGLIHEDEEEGSDMDMMGLDREGEQDLEGEDEGEGGFLGAAGQLPGAAGAAAAGLGGGMAAALEEEEGSDGEEEEDEDMQQQNVRAFYTAVAVASAEAMSRGGQHGAGKAAAAAGAAGGDQLGGLPPLGVVSRRGTRGRCKLHVRLSKPLAGNVLLVKLVSQENLMQLFHDQHDWPNVDMAYVGLKGKVVNLPPGISLAL